jgi:hypothetical protein
VCILLLFACITGTNPRIILQFYKDVEWLFDKFVGLQAAINLCKVTKRIHPKYCVIIHDFVKYKVCTSAHSISYSRLQVFAVYMHGNP